MHHTYIFCYNFLLCVSVYVCVCVKYKDKMLEFKLLLGEGRFCASLCSESIVSN